VTAAGVRVHDRLVEFDDTASVTVLENPFTAATAIEEVGPDPTVLVTAVGLAFTVKSWTVKVMIAEWVRLPLAPVTATCTVVVDGKVQETLVPPEPVKLLGVTLQDVLFVLRDTTPANPFREVMVTLEVPEVPILTLTVAGFTVIAKSWTRYVTVTEWVREALLPVTPTWTVLAEANVHESVALPEPVTLAGLIEQAVLLVAKLTTPAKPFCAETVTVDVPALPEFTTTPGGVRLIAKSWIVKVAVAECDRLPLVPVTATWIVEADAKEHERVELPGPVRLVGEAVHEVLLVDRLTIPAKPLSPDTVMVEDTEEPALPITLTGLTEIVKSWTVKDTVVVWESEPLTPVITTSIVPTAAKLHERLVLVTVHEVLLEDTLTAPPNPFKPVIAIVEVPTEPTLTVTALGLAVIEKSWTVNVTVAVWDNDPLVPVTPTWIVFEELKLQDRFAVPEPVTLVGLTVQDVLFVPRFTTPAKPFSPLTVIVELPDAPALSVMLVGFAAMV
jgi:hypothetical protein